MDMSKAALPPRSGSYSPADRAHAMFPAYREKLASCWRLMIDAPDFRDWLGQLERQERDDAIASHPRFGEFQEWMRDTKAGRRPCRPAGSTYDLCFPENFQAWLEGFRW